MTITLCLKHLKISYSCNISFLWSAIKLSYLSFWSISFVSKYYNLELCVLSFYQDPFFKLFSQPPYNQNAFFCLVIVNFRCFIHFVSNNHSTLPRGVLDPSICAPRRFGPLNVCPAECWSNATCALLSQGDRVTGA